MENDIMNTAFYNEDYEDNFDEYCPDEEEYEDIFDEWPNRGRFGNLPSLSFLKNNYFPTMTEPESIDPYFVEQHKIYNETIIKFQEEKDGLIIKYNKVLEELKKAEDVPKTYSAAKWGAISARDALVKRLTNELLEADGKVQEKMREINNLTASKKTLCDYIEQHQSMAKFHKKYVEERDVYFEEMYGKVEPLTDIAYTHLFFDCEKVDTNDGSEQFYFANQVILEKCMRACKLGGLAIERVGFDQIRFV